MLVHDPVEALSEEAYTTAHYLRTDFENGV